MERPTSRRRVLALCGGVLSWSTAGCSSSASERPTTQRESRSETYSVGETATISDERVTLLETDVQRYLQVRSSKHPKAGTVVSSRSEKYLTYTFQHTGLQSLGEITFVLQTGDSSMRAEYNLVTETQSQGPTRSGIAVPAGELVETAEIAIQRRGGDEPLAAWQLPEETIKALNEPPDVVLKSFDHPEVVSGDAIDTVLTVHNPSSRVGEFVATLGTTDASHVPVSRIVVPAGETVERQERVPIYAEEGETTLVCDWGRDVRRSAVKIE